MRDHRRAMLVLLWVVSGTGCSGPDPALPGGADGPSAAAPDLAQGLGDDGGVPGRARPGLQLSQRYFPDSAPWYRDVSRAALSAESATITAWMVAQHPPGGFGGGGQLRVNFSIVSVEVPAGTPRRAFQTVSGSFYTPDCDATPVPVPAGGAVEQTYPAPTLFTSPFSGYDCAGIDSNADCHLLLVDRGARRLYEIYRATIDKADRFRAGCLAIWDLGTADMNGRGQQCSSADAAGFPIAPLLFTTEEIAAGQINHAIRFILPNAMIRARRYVAPATHGTNTTGPLQAGPYGFRMRLRADYPLATLSPAARVVARALQKYGMLLADGGELAMTAQSDVLSSVKWRDLGFGEYALAALKATDFEVIDFAAPTTVTYDCQRQVITQ